MTKRVLGEAVLPPTTMARAALVVVGVAFIALCAKVTVPMTMRTFAVLRIGAAYGSALGLSTVLAYLILGALGINVFAGDGFEWGLSYMLGGTGGYLVGFALAAGLLGLLARRRWDVSVVRMSVALLLGNVPIYVPGLLWLGVLYGWDRPILAWGLWPFLMGDAIMLALAALLVPGLWRAPQHLRS